MFNVRLACDRLYGREMAVHLAVVGDGFVFYFVLSFSHNMSWMRSGTELNQFLRIVLPTHCSSFSWPAKTKP